MRGWAWKGVTISNLGRQSVPLRKPTHEEAPPPVVANEGASPGRR